MENKKILIVGAGVAGISVAKHLLDRGCDITIIDNSKNDCSTVAGALINPIVFRRMNKSWRLDEFIKYMPAFYNSFDDMEIASSLSPLKLRRMFSSEQERTFWLQREGLDEYKEYLTPLTQEDDTYNLAKNEYGSGRVKNAFMIDANSFLKRAERYLSRHVNWILESFNYSELKACTYKGQLFDDIIFCEGHHVNKNPWFSFLPVTKTKGELLVISAKSIPSDQSINRKCFMLPMGAHTFKIGSTHIWNDDSLQPSQEGRREILENFSFISDEDVKVMDQIVGIRPTTLDRRPIIGTHPEHSSYHIFNGLGTKGYLLAPLLAKEFTDYLLDGKSLDKEVLLDRFIK